AADFATPQTATDSQVAAYADQSFQYDSQHRVSSTTVQAAGSSATAGGLGTFSYTYTLSSNSPGVNSWATKTVETRPDGGTDTVYTNAYGQIMLPASTPAGSSSAWLGWNKYDSAGRMILSAAPSALSGYSDSYADLLHSVSGNYQYLNDSSG